MVPMAGSLSLPVYRTHPLGTYQSAITRAVIVVHGVLRNADEYFADTAQAAVLAKASEQTVVVAPHFQAKDDHPPAGELHWNDGDWKRGDGALNAPAFSSFTALDKLVALFADRNRFPSMQTIVVTGHSAGGQILSRYAALGAAEEAVSGIDVHYVVANPSTYFYPNAFRARAGSHDTFELPDGSCPEYDEYPYGITKLNTYASGVSVSQMEGRLAMRHLTLLLGELDHESEYLDTSCGANLQGPYRYLRGLTYAGFLEHFLKPARLKVATVPGVGHSGRDMYQSPEGQAVLFH